MGETAPPGDLERPHVGVGLLEGKSDTGPPRRQRDAGQTQSNRSATLVSRGSSTSDWNLRVTCPPGLVWSLSAVAKTHARLRGTYWVVAPPGELAAFSVLVGFEPVTPDAWCHCVSCPLTWGAVT